MIVAVATLPSIKVVPQVTNTPAITMVNPPPVQTLQFFELSGIYVVMVLLTHTVELGDGLPLYPGPTNKPKMALTKDPSGTVYTSPVGTKQPV